MKILIIEDNESIASMLSQYLAIKGHKCTVSNSGTNGLELILRDKYDVVILDLAMPGFNGLDIIDHLDKNGKLSSQKIVVLTASSISEAQLKALTVKGVHASLRKPVRLEELTRFITN